MSSPASPSPSTPSGPSGTGTGTGTGAGEGTHLNRTLHLHSLVLFGLAYLAPMIVLGIFGVIAEETGGASTAAYLLALVAMLFTANSYGRMARAIPGAGSAYTYVRRTIDSRVGFLVGWGTMLDYIFLPMVIWLIGASYLQAQFPGVPGWIWIVVYIALTSVLNVIGIRVADRVNFVLMVFQLLVIVVFVALSAASVLGGQGTGSLISASPFTGENSSLAQISAGAAVAAYSFLGFDAVTTLSEETVDPRRTVPRAILLVALIGGGIFLVVTYVTQLVHPGGTFTEADSAAFDIAKTIGGNLFSAIFLAGLVIAQFTSGLAAQASGSRLMFAMGRDGVLPRRFFGRVHPRFQTPWLSIIAIGVIGLIALFLDVATSTSFVNFGAFVAFGMVNLSVIVRAVRARRTGEPVNVLLDVVCPAIGFLVIAYLLTQLDSNALTLGGIWLVIGVIVLTIITRGFRRQPPEVKAEDAA
ncbi:APC family permease [Tersicoccus sp. Bi-70]|uniref:APC family permease n=1 Tax=Tersicoccus sp. Bi-70 TaxID=1897634 RepID=UPI0009FAA5F6|nr:APC family permease [Tersicoccus sp. Bi-70]